ncbi:unnamed protein product [Rotaria sp. Silwood2]|nr:unnamed protein product [Rotaria sp. Silwood2]CAF2810860.1 unnamed protein product [Rotaria sp. Silwood2]CAF3005786.1 unnamed protein product [Rotaria sp. Silwood2]CAF3175130.1 unnamed protein product [Rotaria sp. Silwood2]CAF3957854.1 unnamed protein product [Rotaria sp. Silwood2]
MSITTTTTISSKSPSNERSSLINANHHHQNSTPFHTTHFVNERYPKTCLEDIPSIILEYPPPKIGNQLTRSHHSLRFRTQPVTLAEINEADEENKNDNDNQQQESQTPTLGDFQRLEHLALWENVRRSARKKLPTKNYLERQRLKAMREEPSETDGS